jgi:Ser/Thr protein kinase RdoA (MazF antagonist)
MDIAKTAEKFAIYGEFLGAEAFGGGIINETFVSRWNQAGTHVRYVHQKINDRVFPRPDEVMENILRVTQHIKQKNIESGRGDFSRRGLTVVLAKDGKPWARDEAGGWWRTYLFIEGTCSKNTAANPEEAAFLGESVGLFQKQLSDLPAPRLHEAIAGFHDMEKRYLAFWAIAEKDEHGRANDAAAEIGFMKENENRGGIFVRAMRDKTIKERICHNDTKMNNILVDEKNGKALCMADLDTVMPGTALFDLGDLIRTVAVTASEEETDLCKVRFDTGFFASLLEGYLREAGSFMESRELELLAESGRNITHIMALRFLTDWLDGDRYYRTQRPGHNLDRCRNQIALIKSMDGQWENITKIATELAKKHGRP